MALALLLQALTQGLHQLVEPAQRLHRRNIIRAQSPFRQVAQKVLGQVARQVGPACALQPLEHLCEHAVEPVEKAFVLDQAGAGEDVEIV